MKITEGLKVIQNGWIRKPRGFRVKFQRQTETGIESVYSPPLEAVPLNSDVTAWRYAWKLWQATRAKAETEAPGTLYNITVVDDQDHPYPFYGTGDFETYNPKRLHGGDDPPAGDSNAA
ncbi:hypothetical protein DSCA_46830 [Desulfosarcina alkanivorans]|jgi:hypothetical protein|uniref:Uncharacterized protein n=1 Tax=Desulfosarcina alkanivorans TaxID=571177 RepID=A0A5K7YR40_9BACT|nr:hypothetical protein [Desulfosarcina alkanivorans]BBO70753.1 hypothetical protein DSCA_46830 [Desulfosarcina alkanivorans]